MHTKEGEFCQQITLKGFTHTYTYICAYIYTHMYVHTYMYIHISINTYGERETEW